MAKLDIINLKGEKTSDLKLNDSIWNIETNDATVKKAIDLQLASLRQGTHKTKTRSEVSGGGRKPYRQKGTGNARQGSIRAPHYVGGGVVFGVTPRSYTFKMNKRMFYFYTIGMKINMFFYKYKNVMSFISRVCKLNYIC